MSWIKKGAHFLSNVPMEKLKKLYKGEKNLKAKLRLLAAIQRKQGKTLEDIAYSLAKPKITIHDWLKRFEQFGLKKIYDTKQTGRPPKLTKKELLELENVLESSPQKQGIPFVIWTTKLVQYIILKLFKVKYELWNIRKLTKKLGFTFQVPRQRNKKANKKLQEEFKKNLKKKYNITLNLDSRSSVLTKHTSS